MAIDNKISPTVQESLSGILASEGFGKLNDNLKGHAINSLQHMQEEENATGKFGKLFGTKTENTSLYIAFTISAALIIVGLIYILLPQCYKGDSNLEFWKVIGPIITGALGFIFGANSKSK